MTVSAAALAGPDEVRGASGDAAAQLGVHFVGDVETDVIEFRAGLGRHVHGDAVDIPVAERFAGRAHPVGAPHRIGSLGIDRGRTGPVHQVIEDDHIARNTLRGDATGPDVMIQCDFVEFLPNNEVVAGSRAESHVRSPAVVVIGADGVYRIRDRGLSSTLTCSSPSRCFRIHGTASRTHGEDPGPGRRKYIQRPSFLAATSPACVRMDMCLDAVEGARPSIPAIRQRQSSPRLRKVRTRTRFVSDGARAAGVTSRRRGVRVNVFCKLS